MRVLTDIRGTGEGGLAAWALARAFSASAAFLAADLGTGGERGRNDHWPLSSIQKQRGELELTLYAASR